MPLAAELVLATLLETARPGDAGPATVARNAAGRLDTPGGGHIPGDTPWTRRDAPAGARPRTRPAAAPARLPGGMVEACAVRRHMRRRCRSSGLPHVLRSFSPAAEAGQGTTCFGQTAVAWLQRCALSCDKWAGSAHHCADHAWCACTGRRAAGGCGRARRCPPTGAAAPAAHAFCAAGAAGRQRRAAWSWPPSSRPRRGRGRARRRRRCAGLSACAVATRRPARAAALGARRQPAALAARAARRRRAPPRH